MTRSGGARTPPWRTCLPFTDITKRVSAESPTLSRQYIKMCIFAFCWCENCNRLLSLSRHTQFCKSSLCGRWQFAQAGFPLTMTAKTAPNTGGPCGSEHCNAFNCKTVFVKKNCKFVCVLNHLEDECKCHVDWKSCITTMKAEK